MRSSSHSNRLMRFLLFIVVLSGPYVRPSWSTTSRPPKPREARACAIYGRVAVYRSVPRSARCSALNLEYVENGAIRNRTGQSEANASAMGTPLHRNVGKNRMLQPRARSAPRGGELGVSPFRQRPALPQGRFEKSAPNCRPLREAPWTIPWIRWCTTSLIDVYRTIGARSITGVPDHYIWQRQIRSIRWCSCGARKN
jgi:hypothetical protein